MSVFWAQMGYLGPSRREELWSVTRRAGKYLQRRRRLAAGKAGFFRRGREKCQGSVERGVWIGAQPCGDASYKPKRQGGMGEGFIPKWEGGESSPKGEGGIIENIFKGGKGAESELS